MKFRFSVSLLLVSSLLLSQTAIAAQENKTRKIRRRMIHKTKKIRARPFIMKKLKNESTAIEKCINARRFKVT